MAHHLVLLLGTGIARSDGAPGSSRREGRYRLTRYALDDGRGGFASEPVETPFVGEALLRLMPGAFTHVHVFGTADSMWDSLSERMGEAQDDLTLELVGAVEARSLADADPQLARLADAFGAVFGVHATCRVLPLPDTEDHTWEMLRRLASLADLDDGDEVSLDLTHGLRVQPFFLLLAARYLQTVRPGLRLGHVFYGGWDLQREGIAPLHDLRPHVAMLDWIDAARAFDRSADAGPLAAVLGEAGAALAAKALDLTRTLQANALPRFRSDAGAFLSALRAIPEGNVPLDLVRPALERLPRKANAGQPWQALLLVAEHHAEHGRLGLALLSAWEAARARVADVYGKGARTLAWKEGEHVDALLKKVSALSRLRLDRNAVAHATLYASHQDNERLKELRGRVGEVLAETRAYLEGPELAARAALHPWRSLAP